LITVAVEYKTEDNDVRQPAESAATQTVFFACSFFFFGILTVI